MTAANKHQIWLELQESLKYLNITFNVYIWGLSIKTRKIIHTENLKENYLVVAVYVSHEVQYIQKKNLFILKKNKKALCTEKINRLCWNWKSIVFRECLWYSNHAQVFSPLASSLWYVESWGWWCSARISALRYNSI